MGDVCGAAVFFQADQGTEKACDGGPTLALRLNMPPAQTWNYLRVNDVGLEVPSPRSAGEVPVRLPQLFSKVGTGIGPDAEGWIVSSAGDSRYTEVRAGERLLQPIVIDVSEGQIRDTGVLVRENAKASIVIVTHGDGNGAATPVETSATLVRVIAERGARVELCELVACSERRQHLGGVGISAGTDASVEVRQYVLGGGKVALGIATDLSGARAQLDHTMRYLVRGEDLLDVNHVVRQRGEATAAEVRTSGVLADHARKTVRETIDLVHGAEGASGSESETVLISGDGVVNRTLPTILCDEDDVAGNHGASIGSPSPEQLSFLASRGLDETAALELFSRAVFDDAVLHAPAGIARTAVLGRAAEVLGDAVAFDLAEALELDVPAIMKEG